MKHPFLHLNKDQDRRLAAGHLWIYNNEINHTLSPLANFQAGDLVTIVSARNKKLGIAYINPHTLLCARLLTRHCEEVIDKDFFVKRLRAALQRRDYLFQHPYYRLVFSESDGLPGLILDRMNDVIVAQINTAGMERQKEFILAAINEVLSPKAIVFRNDSAYRELEQLPRVVEIASGDVGDQTQIIENDCEFLTSVTTGQKTGWFYDHRSNRKRMLSYIKNKKVLDVFAYLGAFSIPIAKAGANHVTCIDSSATALDSLQHNAVHNQVAEKIKRLQGDAFELLKNMAASEERFDVIILDPPALVKRKKEYHAGLRAYQQLNQFALTLLNPNGILFSASCSMHISSKDLLNCIRQASVNAQRELVVLEQLHQDIDHPIHPAIDETNYLKAYILMVTSDR